MQGFDLHLVRSGLLLWLLALVALEDLHSGVISDRWLLAGAGLFALWAVFLSGAPLWALGFGLIGGVAVSVPLLGLVLLADRIFRRETMGGGDVKLFFVCGLFFGWQLGLLHLILSCVVGLALAPLLKKRDGTLPFAPAICLAGAATVLFGKGFIAWYLSLFGL